MTGQYKTNISAWRIFGRFMHSYVCQLLQSIILFARCIARRHSSTFITANQKELAGSSAELECCTMASFRVGCKKIPAQHHHHCPKCHCWIRPNVLQEVTSQTDAILSPRIDRAFYSAFSCFASFCYVYVSKGRRFALLCGTALHPSVCCPDLIRRFCFSWWNIAADR